MQIGGERERRENYFRGAVPTIRSFCVTISLGFAIEKNDKEIPFYA